MKQYCITCGQPTEYSLIKPKFCSKCGKSFIQNIKSNNNTKIDQFDIELEEPEKQQNIIKNIEFEEIYIPQSNKETLGSILKSSKNNRNDKPQKRKKGKKISKEDGEKMLKEILAESKAIKPKYEQKA